MPQRVPGGGPQPERPDEPGYGREQGGQGRNGDGQYGRGQDEQGRYEQGQYGQGQAGQGSNGQAWNDQGRNGQVQDGQWQYAQGQYGQARNGQAQNGQAQNGQHYAQGQYGQARNGQGPYAQEQYPQGQYPQGRRGRDQSAPTYSYAAPGHYGGPPQPDTQQYQAPGRGPGDPALPGPDDAPRPRKVRLRRTRRFFRRRTVRVISAVLALFLVWLAFSVGQAAVKNNGQGVSANLAEWARDHHLGPVVTFGEWLSYKPPPKGGKPSFSLAVPSGEAVTPGKSTGNSKQAFVPDIPATLKSLAGSTSTGEGQWRVAEKVNGEPAILTTFLRDATYTSQVNGIASIDQRLVKFSLRPGSEDPGPANWGVPDYIPAGQRKGLLATFNGGFKLDSAGGGFYLNGIYHGTLVKGAASIVYEKNGTIKIGEWGRDFSMNSSVEGVRQNLKLLVDRGKVASNANLSVQSSWGATLGGGEYVWRSGIGITKDGRVVYVYGPALSAQDLGELLQRAGAVEGMQMDINPAWMKFDYYQAKSNPSDPVPVTLLPTQQPSAYSYYTPSTRDFTAVYAR
ncbi:MAG TPA: phosphodiester glycosidase family protein [Trebonia sp.]